LTVQMQANLQILVYDYSDLKVTGISG